MSNICPNCNTPNSTGAQFCRSCGTRFVQTGMLSPRTVLGGRYIIVRCVGRGGMGAVYETTDMLKPGKKWAVKEMSDAAITDPVKKQRAQKAFLQEAQLLASLAHRNLPKVDNYFTENNKLYLVMDFVEGQTLEELLNTAPSAIPELQILQWGAQLCDVLTYLHNQSPPIIFRDLKPANIMLDNNGTIKLIDFGIARLFKLGQAQDTVAFGTAGYAPPEQYGHGQTDARSDIYALGVVLHQLATRYDPAQTPFNLPAVRQLNRAVSPELETIITKAIQQQPQARFQNAAALRLALDDATLTITGQKSAVTVTPPTPASLPSAGALNYVWVGAVVTALVIGLGTVWFFSRDRAVPTPTSVALVMPSPTDAVYSGATATLVSPTRIPTSYPTVAPSPTANEVSVAGAGGRAVTEEQPTYTPLPTYTPYPTEMPPTPTAQPTYTSLPTLTPYPTAIPPTRTPRPPTATRIPPTSKPQCPNVTGDFAKLWAKYKDRLGCAITEVHTIPRVAEQPFQNGHMFWRSDTYYTYVIYDRDGDWHRLQSTVAERVGYQPPAPGLVEPERGFGKVWQDMGGPDARIGWATAEEMGFDDYDKAQHFDNGIIFRDSDGKTRGMAYVLFYDGTFVRDAY